MHRTTALAALAAAPVPNPMDASIPGTVAHCTLAPKSEVDGFVLRAGTQMHVPPHQAAVPVFTARPGDAVAVHLARGAAGWLAPGRSVVAEGPLLVTPMATVVEVRKLDSGPGAS